MKIINNVSCNYIDQYWSLSIILSGEQYFPFIRAYFINYSENLNFTISILQSLFPEYLLTGTLKKVSFEEIKTIISSCLSWQSEGCKQVAQSRNVFKVQSLEYLFFDILRYGCGLNVIDAQEFWLYIPKENDYFSDAVYWSFCFVIIFNNKIIVYSAKAMQFPDQTKSESEHEEHFRRKLFMLFE